MKNKFKLGFIFILTIITGLVLIACDNGDDTLDKALTNLTVETILGDNESKDAITKDLALPTKDGEVVITWDSNKPAVITAAGKVIRQDADETVRLTATLSYDGAEEDKHFDLVVLKADGEVVPDEEFTVTFNSDGGTSVASQTVEDGAKATKPANPTKAGSKFLGWFLGEVEFDFDTAITADITLIAKWEEEEEADTITILTARGKDLGDEVTISGVVTRNYNGNIAVNDGTAAIIVYENDSTVEVGDKILATGTLSEYFQTIQISGGTITVLESDQALPNPVTLTTLENISDYHANHLTIENLEFISIDSSNRNITAKLGDFEVVVRAGSSSGAVADLFKTIKIGDLINVENVYADSYNGVIQLLVTEIESIEVEEKELTDLEKINFVKDELTELLNNKEFEMGSDANLPATSLFESTITWESTPVAVVDGKWFDVTADTPVELTATINVGDLTKELMLNVTIKFIDPLVDEILIYETGFEASEGFETSTVYNNADPKEIGASERKWTVTMGTPTTTQASSMGGGQTLQMRYYIDRTELGELTTLFKLNVGKIEFDSRFHNNNNGLNVKVSYSIDNENWIDIETYELTGSKQTFTVDSFNVEEEVYIRFTVVKKDTEPSGTVHLLIDNVKFYSVPGEGSIDPVESNTVTFDTGGGNTIDPLAVEEGNKVTQPEDPTKEGFTFLGWFLGETEFDFATEITEDITLVAKWEVDETIANVSTLAELEAAIADEAVLVINLTADINATEMIVLSRSNVTIDGKGFKIIRPEATEWVSGDAFVLQVYLADEVVVKDLELVGANGALLVNGAKVSVSGLTLTSQSHGGIEVSKGFDVETNPQLTLDGEILHDLVDLPIIWIDGFTENNDFVLNHELETFVPEGKTQLWFVEKDAGHELSILLQSDFGKTDGWGAYGERKEQLIENGILDLNPNGSTSWDLNGGNVNNTGWDHIRMGGKNASTKEDAQVHLKTNFTFNEQVTEISLDIVGLDSAAGNELVWLQISTNGSTWTDVTSKEITETGELLFDELTIAEGNYIRFVIVRGSTGSNSGTDIKTITFKG